MFPHLLAWVPELILFLWVNARGERLSRRGTLLPGSEGLHTFSTAAAPPHAGRQAPCLSLVVAVLVGVGGP